MSSPSACHRLRRALIYITKAFTLMPERVLTTLPVRHPPITVASDGQLGSKTEPSVGVLLADPMSNARFTMFSVIPESSQSAGREAGAIHGWRMFGRAPCLDGPLVRSVQCSQTPKLGEEEYLFKRCT